MTKELYLDHPTINWVLEHCKILHLGLTDGTSTYVVPVHYGFEESLTGTYTFYIHGTASGLKGQALDQNPVIGFETDGGHEHLTYTPPKEGAFGPAFRSVMGRGQVVRLTDNPEKLHALRQLLHHYVRDIPVALHPETMTNVPVWRIDVTAISARVHHPTADWQQALGLDVPLSYGIHYDDHGAPIANDMLPTNRITAKPDATTGASKRADSPEQP